ncbi:MAG: peptidoglycan-binding protein [Clostridia bacterium]
MRHGQKRLLAAAVAMALLLPIITSALAVIYPYETISMDDVNMRSRANTTSTVLKRIKAGDTVSILAKTGNYYQIKFDGKTGYAVKKFIDGTDNSPDPSPDPGLTMQAPPAVTDYPYDTTVVGRVKQRKNAKADGDVIQTILPDSVITVYSLTSDGFAKVKCKGKTGYVPANYVNLASIPTPAPKATPTLNPDAEKYTVLQKGSVGNAVIALQSALIELGYLEGKADGKFGAQTEAALIDMQKRNGKTKNGIADQALQLLIYEGTPKDTRGYRQHVKTIAPVPGATVRSGATGDAVTKLQNRLKELGYYFGKGTGTCDKETVEAIQAFQAKHFLEQSGEADSTVQAVLYGATALSASTVITPVPSPTPAPPTGTVRAGDKSKDATLVQQRLKDLGYYKGKVTGTFNTASVEALKEFQTKNKLSADGVCGPQTRAILFASNPVYGVPTAMPVVTAPATQAPITEDNVVVILSGSRGNAVLQLQQRLQELGYYSSRLDGVYLTEDITAVRAFQSTNGLKVDGKAGFQTQSLLYSENAIRGNPTTASATLRYGDTGAAVTAMQSRLIELGYMSGSADGNFGLSTRTALLAFQKANKLTRDGVAGAKTLAALNATGAVSGTVPADTTLKVGAVGDAVKQLQNRLITLGYLKAGSADGTFGVNTSMALISFQKANGLTPDGMAGAKTIARLNAGGAISGGNGGGIAGVVPGAPGVSGVNAANVRYANWYTEVKARCKLYPNATVYDFTNGISWQVNMFSLGAHADSEPLTAADTANMNRAFGGKTTWTPKAVWIVFSDGRIYMASTHNTPHETSHIRDNNFPGHLCIHFPRTQTQVEAIGPYATSHQKAIDLGWSATLRRAAQ